MTKNRGDNGAIYQTGTDMTAIQHSLNKYMSNRGIERAKAHSKIAEDAKHLIEKLKKNGIGRSRRRTFEPFIKRGCQTVPKMQDGMLMNGKTEK